jgi:hypothetical protein
MIESDAALACGFVDELTVAEQVTTRALHWLGELLALPSQAMLATRALARADLIAAVDPDTLPLDDFIDAYYPPEAQATLQQLVARLKNKG